MSLPINTRQPSSWLRETGPAGDVVLSSRVRFARNLRNFPFKDKISEKEQKELRSRIFSALDELNGATDLYRLNLEEFEPLERQVLAERRLCSEEFIETDLGGLAFSADEDISLMVNEEDHLRMQSIVPGNNLEKPFERVREVERFLDDKLAFAFDDKLGFLTACPTNLGTGFRASVLLHLPALVVNQKINKVLKAVSNLGLAVRGFYGEGSESRGFYFQLSNQVTLGRSVKDFKESLQRVVEQIISQERQARKNLTQSTRLELEDRIGRSYGILSYARQIETDEALQLLSLCRLGVDREMVPPMELSKLDGLLQLLQPAHLQYDLGEELSGEDRDYYRAKKIVGEFSPTKA